YRQGIAQHPFQYRLKRVAQVARAGTGNQPHHHFVQGPAGRHQGHTISRLQHHPRRKRGRRHGPCRTLAKRLNDLGAGHSRTTEPHEPEGRRPGTAASGLHTRHHTMNRPLEGIRIVEIGHMLAGPYCGLLLADLGADVIKIEPPEGDIARKISPHQIGPYNAYFGSLNRNKRSIVLDLASPEGKAALGDIVENAHALITNLRPSAIKKLGLTYDTLRARNEKLVCVALTGYGLDGPYAERPAYDYVIQAMTGLMSLTGAPDAAPTKAGYSAVDNSAGIMAALALLAKIIHGKGGQVDVAMYDVMLSQLNYLAGATLNTGEQQQRFPNSSHPYIVPAQIFQTADGWLTLFITHDKFWEKFCL